MRFFSKLYYYLCHNLISSSPSISSCYDFQSISTVSYLSPLSLVSPVPSFPSTLAKYVWISFTLFSVLIMGLWGCICTCWVFASFSPYQILSLTHLWYQYPFLHLLQDITNENCHQTNSLHYTFLLWHLEEALRSDLVGLWWTKRQILKQLLCAATRRQHMDGCMHAHTMNANTNNCLNEDKVFLQLNWSPRLQSQLPLTHSSNPPLLQLPFVSAQNLSCL